MFPVAGKVPRTTRGLLDATTDRKQIEAWWERWPTAGIAAPMGKITGRIAIDIDPRHGGERTLLEWEKKHGQLPYTLTSETGGGGVHLLYLYPEDVEKVPPGANVLGPGVDVRGDGSYIVLPPSPHQSGVAYRWQDPDADIEMPPDALVRAIVARGVSGVPQQPIGLAGASQRIISGERNVALTRLAGKLRRAGLDAEAIEAALIVENEKFCDPPLEPKEVGTIARSIGRREGDPIYTPSPEAAAPDLVDVGADEIASMDLPEREYILSPVFQEKNICMIAAERGIGKTIIGVGWALAIAGGERFLRWTASRPRRVLYIDGELPIETMQKRIRDVARSAGLRVPAEFRIVTPDLQPGQGIMPNIATAEGQKRVLEAIDRVNPEVVFLDNLSTLVRGGAENEAESWQIVQDFLVSLRSRRVSTTMLHHTGKSGDQRGTSKREDVIDLSIILTRPEGYTQDQGARIQVEYTKTRDVHGDAARAFEAWMDDHAGDGNASWIVTQIGSKANEEKTARLLQALPLTEDRALSTFKLCQLAGIKSGSAGPILLELERSGLAQSKPSERGGGQLWWRGIAT